MPSPSSTDPTAETVPPEARCTPNCSIPLPTVPSPARACHLTQTSAAVSSVGIDIDPTSSVALLVDPEVNRNTFLSMFASAVVAIKGLNLCGTEIFNRSSLFVLLNERYSMPSDPSKIKHIAWLSFILNLAFPEATPLATSITKLDPPTSICCPFNILSMELPDEFLYSW